MASKSGMGSGNLLSLAYPYALDAVDDAERGEIDARRDAADADTRQAFDHAVSDVRETMASAANAATTEPPRGLSLRIQEAIRTMPQDGSPAP